MKIDWKYITGYNMLPILMTVFVIITVCGIGYYIGITTIDEIENHPEITDIGGPPRLENLVVMILVIAIVCGIALKLPVKKDEDDSL